MKTELGEVGGKARLRAGDAEVRRHRQSKPAADRGAMDGGDDRLPGAENTHGLDVKMRDRAEPRGRIGFGARLLLLPRRIVEVGAGAERLALRGQHRCADFDVAVEFIECVRDLIDQRDIEKIQRGPRISIRPTCPIFSTPMSL